MLFYPMWSSLLLFVFGNWMSRKIGIPIRTTTPLLDGMASPTITTYEVCLSPGCIADGAEVTLQKMQALAPSLNNAEVKGGVCCSLCGNGPVVVISGKKKVRKASDKKLLEILFEGQGLNKDQQAIVDAFVILSMAKKAVIAGDFGKASSLYEQGIALGLPAALELQKAQSTTSHLAWLLIALQQQAQCQLKIGDSAAAVLVAKSACELSEMNDCDSLEMLQEAYEAAGNAQGELETLEMFFSLPEPKKLTTMQQNKRREMGFRLQKLQRDLRK